MLTIGVIVSLMLGVTATSMSMRRGSRLIRDQSSSVESDTRRNVEYVWDRPSDAVEIPVPVQAHVPVQAPVPPPPPPPPVQDSQTRLQKLIDQGYSAEVAQVIMENEDN